MAMAPLSVYGRKARRELRQLDSSGAYGESIRLRSLYTNEKPSNRIMCRKLELYRYRAFVSSDMDQRRASGLDVVLNRYIISLPTGTSGSDVVSYIDRGRYIICQPVHNKLARRGGPGRLDVAELSNPPI